MEFLRIDNLSAGYGDITILRDVSVSINKGKIIALVGSNGAGKTTLLKAISGLIRPQSGSIYFDDEDISRVPPHRIIERGIIHIPEGRRLFPEMSVVENLLMGAYSRNDKGVGKDLDTAFSLFPILHERKTQKAGSLSGGEQQMLALGKGIMGDPDLLLIDEMSLGLAPVIVDDLIQIIKELNREGKTIFIVEQDVRLALENSDFAYVLDTGRVTMSGISSSLLEDPDIKKAYLGI